MESRDHPENLVPLAEQGPLALLDLKELGADGVKRGTEERWAVLESRVSWEKRVR